MPCAVTFRFLRGDGRTRVTASASATPWSCDGSNSATVRILCGANLRGRDVTVPPCGGSNAATVRIPLGAELHNSLISLRARWLAFTGQVSKMSQPCNVYDAMGATIADLKFWNEKSTGIHSRNGDPTRFVHGLQASIFKRTAYLIDTIYKQHELLKPEVPIETETPPSRRRSPRCHTGKNKRKITASASPSPSPPLPRRRTFADLLREAATPSPLHRDRAWSPPFSRGSVTASS